MTGVQLQELTCKACNHVWEDNTLTGVTTHVWITHVKMFNCPKCGAGYDQITMKTK